LNILYKYSEIIKSKRVNKVNKEVLQKIFYRIYENSVMIIEICEDIDRVLIIINLGAILMPKWVFFNLTMLNFESFDQIYEYNIHDT